MLVFQGSNSLPRPAVSFSLLPAPMSLTTHCLISATQEINYAGFLSLHHADSWPEQLPLCQGREGAEINGDFMLGPPNRGVEGK